MGAAAGKSCLTGIGIRLSLAADEFAALAVAYDRAGNDEWREEGPEIAAAPLYLLSLDESRHENVEHHGIECRDEQHRAGAKSTGYPRNGRHNYRQPHQRRVRNLEGVRRRVTPLLDVDP